MSTTIYELLDDLRAGSLDQRDKGDKFERLIAAYLKTDPEWTSRFSDVWLWSEWPGRQGRPDTGIDLVAANRDRDDYTAIQCKFYGSGHRVAKADIDSFIAASARKEFSQRLVFDTAAGWSNNAEDTLRGVAQRIDIAYLDDAAIDWQQYSWTTPEVLVPTGKKHLRPHQERAVEDVFKGLQTHDRGKLIMACGTGKTFTSLKIAEDLVGAGGSVLVLVPSIQLLSQSLREWMGNAELDIRPFAVCSDVRVGRKVSDDADMPAIDLTEPATTDAETLLARMRVGRHARDRMTVVFSTYQSIDVLIDAQRDGLAEFDLVICDEAHRTTGVTLAGGDESAFVRVHDNTKLKARKRLYMTATPRVFGEAAKQRATEAEAILADMADETLFGPELHRLGFGDAVEAVLLTDYKVLVLAVEEQYVAENFQTAMAQSGEIQLDDAAKIIGCWNGLAKHFGSNGDQTEQKSQAPMKTAVAFAKDIRASKTAAASFPLLVDRALQDEATDDPARNRLRVEAAHVDGTMGIHERNTHLAWLKAQTPDQVCRILSNARCLSEGVDVPALDAVLFLTPRGSQVDVVQSVGRVMRKAPGKELGYIILPIVVPAGIAPEEALKDNQRYKVVWQVLQALRSHDDRFHAMINQIELNKKRSPRVVIDNVTPRPETETPGGETRQDQSEQLSLDYGFDAFRDAMYARIVQKVGERRYWETWAKDVADIAQAHIIRIKGLLADPDSNPSKEFAEFLTGLRGNLNESITADEAIEMLAQHQVTRPIFQALFSGYDFAGTNPVAKTMELMLASLDEHNLEAENQKLDRFYASVRRRIEGVDNAEGKQRVLVELYDKFFAAAFKKTVDKLGIVYTPVEIVDFILRSADDVLRQEFGQGLTDEGVHILDGFAGTGTFLVRLLQSGLIAPHDLARKYASELHANEILLLAYYIAAVNIETTYQDLTGHSEPFRGLILTDTFQSWEPDDRPDLDVFPENNARLEHLKKLPITVIVGNPPYSVGQESANDDNANERYPALDDQIRSSYVAASSGALHRNLYDSYVRAIKWASLRILDRGVIAFVTNGGFLDSNAFDGMRRSIASEFTSVYVYNLRGNQRTAGEQSRREGGKVFGGGSRATVAITILVKNPSDSLPASIYYSDIGDYLSTAQKLNRVSSVGSVRRMSPLTIIPNEHGDWLNQRREDFESFMSLRRERRKRQGSLFADHSLGLSTSRDAWTYNFSVTAVRSSAGRLIDAYEQCRATGQTVSDPREISWSVGLHRALGRSLSLRLEPESVKISAYRPFTREWIYTGSGLVERPGHTLGLATDGNLLMNVLGPNDRTPFSVLVTADAPNFNFFVDSSTAFPRYTYAAESQDVLVLGDGGARRDNITDEALVRFRGAYPTTQQITKDEIFFYVYGLLHSPEYRNTYAADLKKMLPHIPMVRDFSGYAAAGRTLSHLHLGYESVEPYPLDGLDVHPCGDPYAFYAVGDKKMAFGKVTPEQKAAGERYDRSVIRYNDHITLRGIPLEAYHYMLGSRSAIEWIIDRYYIKTDKASGIVNDPNDWSREVEDPRYILDLLARIVRVSVGTMKIVDALPPLDIIEAK